MRHFPKQLRKVLWLIGAAFPLLASAQSLGDGRAALVVIRFNQPNVYFDQQLNGAVAQAVRANPNVMFDVVAFAPVSGNLSVDQQWQAIAGRNTKSVIRSMQAMGVPMGRINVIGKSTPGLRYDETRLYVR